MLRIGVVSISDRASAGVYADQGVPALLEWFGAALASPWEAVQRLIPDEQGVIEQTLIELADVGAVTLAEGPSRENLEYLLDRSRALTAGQHCQVGVQVRSSGTVQVSYVVPAPLWRLSYRLVRDGDTLILTAMGIVHNPVDEDLTDIALTLTTGEPVSFDIDLYESKHAHREVVEESRRGVAPVVAAGKTRSPAAVSMASHWRV